MSLQCDSGKEGEGFRGFFETVSLCNGRSSVLERSFFVKGRIIESDGPIDTGACVSIGTP